MASIGTVVRNTAPLFLAGQGTRRAVMLEFDFAIGGTGAVGAGTNVPGDVTLARTGAGAYTLSVPSCKRVSTQSIVVEGNNPTAAADRRLIFIGLKDGPGAGSGADGTVKFLVTPVAGTGTGADPVSGSKIHFTITIDWT